jgi:hypothetical protein
VGFFDYGTGYVDSINGDTPTTLGTTYTQVYNGIPYGAPGSATNGSGIVAMQTTGAVLAMNERVQVWLLTYSPNSPMTDLTINVASYTFEGRAASLPDRLNPAACLPDIRQVDLFKTAIRMANLYFQVTDGLIRIESYDNFYKPIQSAWATGSSLERSSNRPVPFAKRTAFEWLLDSQDVLIQRHGNGLYGKTVEVDSVHYSKDTETISLAPFSATIDRAYIARNNTTQSNDTLIIPCMATEATLGVQAYIEWEYNFAPRLLRYIGLQAGRFQYANTSQLNYPAARFACSEVDGLGLLWNSTNGANLLHDKGSMIDWIATVGMYTYWDRFFAMRLTSELVTTTVKVSVAEFAAIDISKPVIVEGIGYVVYSLGGGFDPATDTEIEIGLMRV